VRTEFTTVTRHSPAKKTTILPQRRKEHEENLGKITPHPALFAQQGGGIAMGQFSSLCVLCVFAVKSLFLVTVQPSAAKTLDNGRLEP